MGKNVEISGTVTREASGLETFVSDVWEEL
jgi:hypothetical protein